jgi:hypothetical protein
VVVPFLETGVCNPATLIPQVAGVSCFEAFAISQLADFATYQGAGSAKHGLSQVSDYTGRSGYNPDMK